METPSIEPAVLQAGDTLRWRVLLDGYPASAGWSLAYRLTNAADVILIASAPDGDAHLVQVGAATSAAWPAGEYTAVRYVSRADERRTLDPLRMVVRPDIAAMPAGYDARPPAQRALADLRAALQRWLATQGHVQEYQIAGRQMRFASADEIIKRIAIAEREAQAESVALGQGRRPRRRVLLRF